MKANISSEQKIYTDNLRIIINFQAQKHIAIFRKLSKILAALHVDPNPIFKKN